MTGAFRTSARQIATRCFCPPDRPVPFSPTRVSQPSRSSSGIATLLIEFLRASPSWRSRKSKRATALHSSSTSSETPSSSKPYRTFSRTVPWNNTGSCFTIETCFLHHRMLMRRRGNACSPMRMSPTRGSA
mmetsp:Transcript_30968/g.72229  ORF Transcript_30968/g.72229 Transcript_30968/m.72229 type:complete len:131 (-) Transcript_30968:3350-3742(-)